MLLLVGQFYCAGDIYVNLFEIARLVSPIIQGWIDDYGGYQRSSLFRFLNKIYLALVKWVK